MYYVREGRLVEGMEALETALDLTPEQVYYRLWLALAFKQSGDLEQADAENWRAYQTDAVVYRAVAAFRLAESFWSKGDATEALDLYREAAMLAPDNPEFVAPSQRHIMTISSF